MRRALELSKRGEGLVEPNPMVGCVIVRNGKIVGEGWHRKFGGPHAEIHALRAAGDKTKGATAYVTLEPCCHFGKTPPCADALIRAGLNRVVAAVKDTNPIVAGRGFARLRKAGIRVETGLVADEAREVLAPFITFQAKKRPYVIIKWAQSLDGKIATRTGDSRWISGPESRAAAHVLRGRVDGVVVGIGTVLADNPELTARFVEPKRIAVRIVLDRLARTPLKSKLVRTARRTPTLIFVGGLSKRASGEMRREFGKRVEGLRRAGCEVVAVSGADDHLELPAVLAELHARAMTNIMVEGGGRVLGSFLDQNLADEADIFVSPRLMGGESARGPLRGLGPEKIAELAHPRSAAISHCGSDLYYCLKFAR